MRTFVFVVDDGNHPDDRSEMELVDVQAARIEAARLLGAMIAHEPEGFWQAMDWRLSVQDTEGLLLFELRALAVEGPATRHGPKAN